MVQGQTLYALLATILLGSPVAAQQAELLDFYLPTCGPCHAMAPTLDRLAAEGMPIRKVDGSREPGMAQRFGVQSYPTFVAVVDGREVGRIVGSTDDANLRDLFARAQQATAPQRPAAPVAAATQTFAPATAPLPVAGPSNPSPSLVASSVRIVLEDPNGRAYGTGTVIDARQGEALVVTCAHLFRNSSGELIPTEGRILIERFDASGGTPRVVEQVAGNLVSYDFEADVALVSLRPSGLVTAAPVAASPASVVVGGAVRSVGCDLGADPTVRDSRVVSLNRYQGSPNIETTGAPVQGRSGGGLFNAEGQLVGVCFAADEQANEGLYAGLASVHAELDRVGLSELYHGPPPAAQTGFAQSNAPAKPAAPSQLEPVAQPFAEPVAVNVAPPAPVPAVQPTAWPDPIVRGQGNPESTMNPVELATLDEVVRRGAESEVVLLIRPKEAGGQTEVLTLDTASPEFVATLRRMRTR